jgi:hypothetical protein
MDQKFNDEKNATVKERLLETDEENQLQKV